MVKKKPPTDEEGFSFLHMDASTAVKSLSLLHL